MKKRPGEGGPRGELLDAMTQLDRVKAYTEGTASLPIDATITLSVNFAGLPVKQISLVHFEISQDGPPLGRTTFMEGLLEGSLSAIERTVDTVDALMAGEVKTTMSQDGEALEVVPDNIVTQSFPEEENENDESEDDL